MRRNSLKHNILFVSVISVFFLYGSINGNHVVNKDIRNTKHINYVRSDACEILKQMRKQYIAKFKPEKVIAKQESLFIVSAYDLSFQSCQKSRGNSEYGITASGYDLRGHTLSSAKIISVDPKLIPLGSKVKLTFKEDKYKKYNSVYTASDVEGKIKGHRIDLFIGDNIWSRKKIKEFGVTECNVEIIND